MTVLVGVTEPNPDADSFHQHKKIIVKTADRQHSNRLNDRGHGQPERRHKLQDYPFPDAIAVPSREATVILTLSYIHGICVVPYHRSLYLHLLKGEKGVFTCRTTMVHDVHKLKKMR